MEYLFVYGTLLNGVTNEMSAFLSLHAEFHSQGYFYGKLFDVGEYPGAILSSKQTEKVYGTVFRLPDAEKVFPVLDAYEEVGEAFPQPNEYTREKITVYTQHKQIICWTYLYNHPTHALTQIKSGDYLYYKSR
jgi:gamma-glutamylcyclotransferase (GGCT)/AIG2-like uncharacterized protein YtfP